MWSLTNRPEAVVIERTLIHSCRSGFLRRLAVLIACIALPCLVRAQGDQPPRSPKGVDPNDWEAYFDWGTDQMGRDLTAADAAIVWASRLRPDPAEPLFARWISFWARDPRLYEKYLSDDEKTLADPRVVEAEALRRRALRRNPFVHEGMIVYLYQRLPGRIRDNPVTRAWFALGEGDLPRALDLFATLVSHDPKQYGTCASFGRQHS
jgi:hypothetical protein